MTTPANMDRDAVLKALERRLGLSDVSVPSLVVALTHPSFTNEQPDHPDNQRLEFLGDAVLGLCVSEMLMEAFQEVDEGQLTLMRASLVNAGALAKLARALDLGDVLQLGKGAAAGGERHRKNVLADAMEAVIGAVFTDLGLNACRAMTAQLLGSEIERLVSSGGIRRDAKSRLQELLQSRQGQPPSYEVVATDGPPHARTFVVRVTVPALNDAEGFDAEGEGRSKKLAEQAAAAAALAQLDPATP